MAGIKLENYAWGLLTASIVATDVAIPYATTTGTPLPSLASGEWFYALLQDVDGNREIIKVSSVSPTILLGVERAQEGTVARAWAAGARVSLALTKQSLMDFGDARFLKLEGGSLDGPLSLPAISAPESATDNNAIAALGALNVVSSPTVGYPAIGLNIRSGNAANTWRYATAAVASWIQFRDSTMNFHFSGDASPSSGGIISKRLVAQLAYTSTASSINITRPDTGTTGLVLQVAHAAGNGEVQLRRGYASTSQTLLQTLGGTDTTPSTELRAPLNFRANAELLVGAPGGLQMRIVGGGIMTRANNNTTDTWLMYCAPGAGGVVTQVNVASSMTKWLYEGSCNVESYQFQARDRIYLRGWDQPRISSGSGGFPADAREGDLHIWG